MVDVVWQRQAFDALDGLIRANPTRIVEIGVALRDLDGRLRADPIGTGESRSRPVRVITSGPLTLYFQPARGGRVLFVTRVRLRDRR